MILTRLFLFLAAVGIAAAAPGNPDLEPEKNGPLKDILKSFTGLANAVFQIRLRPEDKPNPTVEFDTPKDCKGKFPEFYRTRSGMMINVLCLRDHPGGDFATLWVKSWTICAEVCSWKSGCIAFSFEGVDKKGTNCWLKKKIHQVPPKSPHVWAGVVVRLQDIPESKRKQWESYIGPRQTDVPPPEPYRPWFIPGAWVVPKVQGSILDCYNCGWEAPRAALPRAIEFFCRGGQNQSYGSLWKNDTVFSSAPLGLMYWSKEIPLLRFLVTAHLNSSVHLKQPGFKERCVDNLSRAMNQCDEGSKNGYENLFLFYFYLHGGASQLANRLLTIHCLRRTTRGGFVIDDMARWGIDPQPQTRVTECEWHTGNGTEDPWCSTWHKEPAAARYDMVTVDCPLATAALHY
ncbi:hypothetical protein QBC39DRAFT_369818 [Podospora conica]|nr:hypothetical protein QBC39DRAFT_369818 [Schizothecium conicum]